MNRNKILAVFLLLLSVTGMIWGEWIDISPGKLQDQKKAPEVRVEPGEISNSIHSTKSFNISITIPGFNSEKQELDNVIYDKISIPGCTVLNEIGKPAVPVKKIIREIPENCTADLSITQIDEIRINNINLLPAQLPLIDSELDNNGEVKIDRTAYSSHSLFPERIILSKKIITMRDRTFLVLEIAPLRVNAAGKTIVIARQIDIEVTLSESQSKDDNTIVSYQAAELEGSQNLAAASSSSIKKYMILMDDQFEDNNSLMTLIEWKRKKGYEVNIVKTSDINPNGSPESSEIEAYMQNLSNEAYPDYLLIIGDNDLQNGVHGRYFSTKFGAYTDLYIACRDTNDWIPDLAYGRLPASNNEELTIMLTKVLTMDRTPPVSNMYEKVLVAAQIQASNNIATRWFCETADYVSCYFEQNAGNVNYDLVRAFVNPDQVTADCLWNTGLMWEGATLDQRRIGTRIFDTFISDTIATDRIVTTINNGTSLVLHRDHGNTSGWVNPPFSNSEVMTLTNGNNLPAFFSINCLSGSFSNPTSFARKLLNHESGGASAVIGAVDVSYSGYNDWLTHGLFAGFLEDYRSWHNNSLNPDWPADLPAPPVTLLEGKAKKLGDMLNFAKFYMYSNFIADSTTEDTFKLFHLVGDPEADIRLHNPVNLNITHEAAIETGNDLVTVTTGDDTVTVCLYSEALGIQLVAQPVNGTVTFPVTSNKPGTIYVTVTGFGKRPYEGTISVIPASGLYISSPLPESKLIQGMNQEITWQTFENFTHVNLDYSTDNGTTYQNIAASITNTNSYNWILPDVTTDNLIIRISNSDGTKTASSGSISLRPACSISGMVYTNQEVEIFYKGPYSYSGSIIVNQTGSYQFEELYPGEYTIYARENLETTEIQTISLSKDVQNIDFTFKHIGFNYQIMSDWQDGFTATVTITNNTDKQLNNWKLGWTFPGNQTIGSMWSGQYEQAGQSVFVSHDWNTIIPANGGTATFGFSGTYSGINDVPTNFAIVSSEPKVIKDIAPGSASSNPQKMVASGNILYFVANDGNFGSELWKSYGLEQNTMMVKDIKTGGESTNIYEMTDMNNKLYFFVVSTAGSSLWVSDGTEGGTYVIKDNLIAANYLTNVENTLFFIAYDQVNGMELWKSDGTTAGTVLVKDIYPGPTSSNIRDLVNMNGILYFITNDDRNDYDQLWKSDGTAAGTEMVNASGYINRNTLTPVGNTLYFTMFTSQYGIELWKTDGTQTGTVIVKDIIPLPPGPNWSSVPRDLTNINGNLYFTADSLLHGRELWMTDGTEAGTVIVKDISAYSSDPENLINVNGMLYFTANDGVHGRELWKCDGTGSGTVMVKDLTPGSAGSVLEELTYVHNTLFFTFNDTLHGKELWQSDGTENGTIMVKDIRTGSTGSNGANLTGVDNILYFTADDGKLGNELWLMLVGF